MSDQVKVEDAIDAIVDQTVQAANPRRIIVFGSAAKGNMGPDSDIDILVVMPDGVHRQRTTRRLYRSPAGLCVAEDIVVVTESDVRNYRDNPSLVRRAILLETMRELKLRSSGGVGEEALGMVVAPQRQPSSAPLKCPATA